MNGSLAQLRAAADRRRRAEGVGRRCRHLPALHPDRARRRRARAGCRSARRIATPRKRRPYRQRLGRDAEGSRRPLVIVGHSERRADQRKRRDRPRQGRGRARAGLQTIVCVGESEKPSARPGRRSSVVTASSPARFPERGRGRARRRLRADLGDRHRPHRHPADVAEMHAAIRAGLAERFGERGGRIRILYGGSVKADNAAELFAVPTSTAPSSAAPASPPPVRADHRTKLSSTRLRPACSKSISSLLPSISATVP
jgi:hypothetical protein